MSAILVTTRRFADHLMPPGHPERAERAEVMQAVADWWKAEGGAAVEPLPATPEQLLRVHGPQYVEEIRANAGHAAALDLDTYMSPDSYEVALLAAGAAVLATELVLGVGMADTSADTAAATTRPTKAFAMVRPPGHHAERDRARGFCIFNNAAIAAAHALELGLSRVAVVDYDVHHCNGTQWTFYEDPRVFVLSAHRFPFFPGTGASGEAGVGDGEGFTLNVPLDAGATDWDYELVFTRVIVPVLREFSPELVIVSAGFDAHERDPLGGMRLSTEGFAALNRHVRSVADDCAEGRMVLVTEGGYDLPALAACLQSTIQVIGDDGPAPDVSPASLGGEARTGAALPESRATYRGLHAIELVRMAQRRYWPRL